MRPVSSGHTQKSDDTSPDETIEYLLELDGELFGLESGYWVKFIARRVEPDELRPHGIDYCLTLHNPQGERLLGYDNSHPVRLSKGPAGRTNKQGDHRHWRDTVRPYNYADAATLMEDFWADVETILKEEGIHT